MKVAKTSPPRAPRRRWRLLLAAFFGLLLGLAGVFFLTRVHDPFATHIASPLALMPEDLDLVLEVPELPRFVAELQKAPFVAGLERHAGFQRFLSTPFMRRTGIQAAIQDAFRGLEAADARLPLGLRILGDLSGQRLTLGVFEKGQVQGEPDLFLVIQPDSWLALAAVNVLRDPFLAGFGIGEELSKGGIALEHRRDIAVLTPRGGRPFGLTRIGDAILVSTDLDLLARNYGRIAAGGIPSAVHPRFAPLEAELAGPGQRVRIFGRVPVLDRTIKLKATLEQLWGYERLRMARGLLWPIAETDALIELGLGRGLDLKIDLEIDGEAERSLAAQSSAFDLRNFRSAYEELAARLPEDAFGLLRLDARPGHLARHFLVEQALLSSEDRRLIDEALARVPTLGSLQQAFDLLDRVTRPESLVVFFRQPREALEDEAEAGLAIFARIDREGELRERLDALIAEIQSAQTGRSSSPVRSVQRSDADGVTSFVPDLAGGVVSDDRVMQPGIAIQGEWLIVTNFAGLFDQLRRVQRQELKALREHQGIDIALASAPRSMRVAAALDGARLGPYLDQSVDGWVTKQVRPSATDFVRWAEDAARDARSNGLEPGTPAYEEAIDVAVRRAEAQRLSGRDAIEREFRARIEEFRGLLGGLGVFLERSGKTMSLSFRIELAAP